MQRQPQENAQKKLLWKSPSGWRHYSPTDRSDWPPTGRQILATIVIVVALVSLSLIGYSAGVLIPLGLSPSITRGLFEWWLVAVIAAIPLIGIGHRKLKRLPTRVWKA